MAEQSCGKCAHFRQHYVLTSRRAVAVNCGHCTHPRMKTRKPDAKACIHFVEQTEQDVPDRMEVIRYLNTEVLQFVLGLELPPEIE